MAFIDVIKLVEFRSRNEGQPEDYSRTKFEEQSLHMKLRPLRDFLIAIMEQERDEDLNELCGNKKPIVDILKNKESDLELGVEFRHVLQCMSTMADAKDAGERDRVQLSALVTGRVMRPQPQTLNPQH